MIRRYAGPAIAATCAALLAAGVAVSIHSDRSIPNPRLTPGDVLTTDLATIKEPNYSKSVRNVSEAEKRAVAMRYGVDPAKLSGYEIDHCVPLSWGGSNAVKNLWPQPYSGQWNARVKDKLEVHGLAMIRRGELDLKDAQREIAADWKAMYRRLIGRVPIQHASEDHEQ